MSARLEELRARADAIKHPRPPDPPKGEALTAGNGAGLQEDVKGLTSESQPTPLETRVKALSVSVVESVDANSKITRQSYTWSQIVERIRTVGEKPSKAACRLLKLATFGDKRNKKGALRHDANVVEVFGIEGDYDSQQVSPADAAARLEAAGVCALIYTSPSHKPEAPRWRVLAPLSRSCAPAERARFVDLLNGAFGGILATESWTLSQVFYFGRVGGSPYEVHAIDGLCIDELEITIEPIGKPGGASTPVPAVLPPSTREWAPGELDAAVTEVRQRAADAGDTAFEKLFGGDTSDYNSNHSQADLALATRAAGYCDRDPDITDAVVRASSLMREKWKRDDYRQRTLSKAVTNAPAVGPAADDDFEIIVPEQSAADAPIAVVTPGKRPKLAFSGTRKGKHPATIENIATALRVPEWCGFDLAFDKFRDEVMIAPRGTQEWRALSDEGTTQIMEAFGRAGFRPIARETMRNTISMVAVEHKFDSAILWLNGLAWDGVPRIERFLTDYCHAEDSPYSRAVALYLWTALAGRVLEPGCKADSVPILVGGQGAKKTTAASELVVDPDHFTTVNLAERDETLSRKMRGRLVGEISELRGLGTRDLEGVKSFISATHEEWVPKYREFPTQFARRLVFIGTTNNQEFLSDETGNRRWLPIRVADINLEAMRRDRLQLWAEGAATWRATGVAWKGAETLAPTEHSQYMISDSWESLFERWADGGYPDDLGGTSPPRRGKPFTTAEVMQEALGLSAVQMTRVNELRVAKLLRVAGFEQKVTKIGNKSRRVWVEK